MSHIHAHNHSATAATIQRANLLPFPRFRAAALLLAEEAGFEPALSRLTAGCITALLLLKTWCVVEELNSGDFRTPDLWCAKTLLSHLSYQ